MQLQIFEYEKEQEVRTVELMGKFGGLDFEI